MSSSWHENQQSRSSRLGREPWPGLFAVGWVLFGLASLRARVFPVLISIAIIVGGLVGFLAAAPPYGVALGLALVGLGAWLMRAEPSVGATNSRATVLAE